MSKRIAVTIRITALVAATASLTACGITGHSRTHPGFARLGSIDGTGADREFGISVGPLPLTIARRLVIGSLCGNLPAVSVAPGDDQRSL